VGEAGTLELLAPVTTVRRSAFTEALPLAGGFEQRFEAAYRLELQAWVSGSEGGATAWDGYAAAVVCEAAVNALETSRPVDIRFAQEKS